MIPRSAQSGGDVPGRFSRKLGRGAVVVGLAVAFLLLPWLGLTLFNSKGEPREAIVAVSILQSGNWILPVNYGGDIPYKPPFMAWIIALLSMAFNGGTVTEYLSRLPSALAALFLALAGYRWAAKARGVRFGVIFALVGATSVEVFRASMACRLDMVLTACMVGALYLMYGARESKGGSHGASVALRYAGAWLLLTCAVLTKGPVGALLPCAALGLYRLLRGDNFFSVFLKMLALALAAMVLPAVWYYRAWLIGGDGFYRLAWEENIGRLTGTMSYDSHLKPFWYNFLTLAAGLLPWTLVAAGGLFAAYRRPRLRLREFLSSVRKWVGSLSAPALLALSVSAVVFVFYCIPASKRSVYLLPMYPFVCYGIAVLMTSARLGRFMKGFAWILASMAVVVPPAFVLGGMLGLISPAETAHAAARSVPTALLSICAGLAWMWRQRDAAMSSAVIVVAILVFYASAAMPAILNPRSDAGVVEELRQISGEGPVYTLGHGEGMRLYTLNYYLDDRLRALPSADAADTIAPGTPVLLIEAADTAAFIERGYEVECLLPRGCDHRRPIFMARKL